MHKQIFTCDKCKIELGSTTNYVPAGGVPTDWSLIKDGHVERFHLCKPCTQLLNEFLNLPDSPQPSS